MASPVLSSMDASQNRSGQKRVIPIDCAGSGLSFLLGTFLWTSKEKYLAIATQWWAKQIIKRADSPRQGNDS